MVARHQTTLTRAAAALLLLVSPVVLAQGQTYIGAERCSTCHPYEFRTWKSGPHATAHESLSKDQRKDAKCNTCHTMLPTSEEPRFAGIQCERCHGPARYYHPRYVMKDKELARAVGLLDPSEAQCRSCHTEGAPSVEPFDFAAFWARITHGKPAREAWEKAKKEPVAAKP